MNIKTISYRFILTAVMMALAPPFTAEAQFLQKLPQGLEKVNKGLEKFEKALQPGNKKVENKPKQTAQDSQSTTSTSRSSADESAQKDAEPSYMTPYFTAQTKFMITNPSDYDISDVHDGVFAVKRGMGYEFWKVTGEKLFDADWKYAGGSLTGFPIFSDGVTAAKRYSDKKGEFSVNMFAVPLKIVGIQKDDADTTKQWLVVEGGSFSIHNIEISTASDPLFGMALQGMMTLDGFTSISSQSRRYRIEMLDRNPETGEFRFGNMQTYSTEAGGWVYGDDPSLKKTTKGFFGSYNDRGYSSDTFAGARMTKTQKRNDILWYPPEKWSKDKSDYQQMVQSMGAAYRNSKSDYGQIFDE